MLKQLIIKNFQSHKKSIIDFTKGVNVIVGVSDSGKSVILKALYWLCFNRPSGNEFENWDNPGKAIEVSGIFTNGILTRKKSKKFNGYILEHKDKEKEEYKGIGQGVLPDPISSFISMNQLNFQLQTDPSFMLSWSAGECGQFLNEVTDLEIIDTTISNNKKAIREETNVVAGIRENVKEAREELSEYKFLPEYDTAITKLENSLHKIEQLDEAKNELEELLNKISRVNKKIKKYETLVSIDEKVNQLILLNEKSIEKQTHKYSLSSLLNDIENTEHDITTLTLKIKSSENKYERLMPEVCPLCEQKI